MSVTLIIYIALLGYIYFTIFFANHTDLQIQRLTAQQHTDSRYLALLDNRLALMRTLLFTGVSFIGLFIPFLLLSVFNRGNAEQLAMQGMIVPEFDMFALVIGLILCFSTTFIAYRVVTSKSFRIRIANRVSTYNPDSWVHQTAIVFMMLLITAQIILFLVQGGTEAMAQSIETQGANVSDLLFQLWLQIIAAFLGVGWAIRRDWSGALQRLGLRLPIRQDWIWGVGGGIGLLGVLFAYSIILGVIVALFFPQQAETIEALNRANDSIATAFSTLPLAFVLSASAAIGEEILFRGALQPVFGNIFISIFFALLHVQSLLSPAIILLFSVSMLLGVIRNCASTSAAMIAHFIYNFVQLVLAMIILSFTGGI